MTTVEITALGHAVKVDVPDGDLVEVAAVARELWAETRIEAEAEQAGRGAAGFTANLADQGAGGYRRLDRGQAVPVRASAEAP